MSCPNCGKNLHGKTIKTVGAGKIDVDYCAHCGGIFFDQGEVNRISTDDAKDLVEESTEHAQPTTKPRSQDCPRCGTSLKRFFGEAIPEDVHVLRCPSCSGTWFDSDELTRFKKAQDAKLNYYRTWKLPLPSLSTVLLPVALLIFLTGVTFITVEYAQRGVSTQTTAQDVMTRPTVIAGENDTSAIIIFTTTEPSRTTLDFWYNSPFGKTSLPISNELSTAHQIEVQDLTPGKKYRYQIHVVTAESSFVSEEYVFEL